MRRLYVLLMLLIMLALPASTVFASEPAVKADPALVASLLPGYTMEQGIMGRQGNTMFLLMHNPAGELVFIGCDQDEDTWRMTESTPLPEGTFLGVENFTHSLGIPRDVSQGDYCYAFNVAPNSRGTWGVTMFDPPADGTGLFLLGENWILREDETHAIHASFGVHPWSDITSIDWTALPASCEDALARLDPSGWAVVCNPDPADRLHLRVRPDRDAASMGKYYNRTPVQVLERGSTWTKVQIGTLTGWMMTEYLAFGKDMDEAGYAGPWLMTIDDEAPLYASYSSAAPYRMMNEREEFYVIGIVSDEWYHIWLSNSNEYAYIRQDALWPGNG